MRTRGVILATALVVAMAVVLPAHASPDTSSSRVSGPSPFPAEGCGQPDEPVIALVAGSAAGAEADLTVAVNPADEANIVAAWVQDAGLGLVAASSFDAGKTWTRTVVPGLTTCSGGPSSRILHARLSFGPDGRAWLAGEALEGFFPDPRSGLNPIPVVTSTDGGRTWSTPSYVNQLPAFNGFNVIAAEPDVPGAAVVPWHTPEPAATTYIARSVDGGKTWTSKAVPGYADGSPDALPVSRIIPAPDGTWHLLRVEMTLRGLFAGTETALVARRSTDKGTTWSDPVVVTTPVPPQWAGGGVGPDGTLYSAWLDTQSRMIVSRSTDSGASWTPGTVAAEAVMAPTPTLAVSPTGAIAVAFTTTEGVEPGFAQQLVARSNDQGQSWHVTGLDDPFPAPSQVVGVFGGADGGFIDGQYEYGYYQETAATPSGGFVSIHQRGGDVDGPSDAYVSVIGPSTE